MNICNRNWFVDFFGLACDNPHGDGLSQESSFIIPSCENIEVLLDSQAPAGFNDSFCGWVVWQKSCFTKQQGLDYHYQ